MFGNQIDELLACIYEFNEEWKRMPSVFRVARIEGAEEPGKVTVYRENISLPNTKHDLDLIIKMMNYLREQKQLKSMKMPLFVNPDEISLAHKEGKIGYDGGKILSQLFIVFQKGAIFYIGFVFGREYIILQN